MQLWTSSLRDCLSSCTSQSTGHDEMMTMMTTMIVMTTMMTMMRETLKAAVEYSPWDGVLLANSQSRAFD